MKSGAAPSSSSDNGRGCGHHCAPKHGPCHQGSDRMRTPPDSTRTAAWPTDVTFIEASVFAALLARFVQNLASFVQDSAWPPLPEQPEIRRNPREKWWARQGLNL